MRTRRGQSWPASALCQPFSNWSARRQRRGAVTGTWSWVMVAVGWAALYFKQASRGDSEAGDPADHTLRNWAPGEESARNRCSVNM